MQTEMGGKKQITMSNNPEGTNKLGEIKTILVKLGTYKSTQS